LTDDQAKAADTSFHQEFRVLETVQALIRDVRGFRDIHMEDFVIHQACSGVWGYSDGGLL